MRKMMVVLLVLATLLSCYVIANATTSGQLQDGDNVMELPWQFTGEAVYTYTATQNGTLYITATEFFYSYLGGAYADNSDNMGDWEGMLFTVDGQKLQYLYYGSIQVKKGQTYTFVWKDTYPGDFGWKATINLSYTDEAQPKQGSAAAPVKLHPQDCPTGTVWIEPGEIAYYQLWDFEGTWLSVTGENAYILMRTFDPDTMESIIRRYDAVDGVATAPINTSLITIQIGNDGEEARTFRLTWAYPEGSKLNPKPLVEGENTAVTQTEDYDGYYFTWTSRCYGNLVLTFPKTGWMYSVLNNTTGEKINTVIYNDENATNEVQIEVSKGDVLTLIVNSFDHKSLTVPGGEVVFTVTEAFNHRYGTPVVTQPTDCKEGGKSVSTCKLCRYELVEIIPGAHNIDEVCAGSEASCGQNGTLPYWHCAGCDTYFADEALTQPTTLEELAIPSLEHTYVVTGTTEGTCVVRSTTIYTCSVCGHTYSEEGALDENKHGDTQMQNTSEAACARPGYTGDICCADCGKVLQAGQEIPALGHHYTCTATTPGTCVEKATNTYTCDTCADQYVETGELNADQHGQTELKNAADATCVTSGYTGDTCCVDCGKVLEVGKTIATLGHALECTQTVAGTCVIKSSSTYTCTVCGYSYVETGKVDDTNHVNSQMKDVADATCVIDGYTGNQVCMDCGALLVEGQVIKAAGHHFGEWTTTEDGRYRSRVCTTCGHAETEDLGCQHSQTHVTGAVEATCTTAGYTGDTCCVDCGKVMQAGSGIPANGHDYVCTATTPGSCTEKETSTYTCSVCGDSHTEVGELDAQQHGALEQKNATEATCTENGYTGDMFCVECNQLVTAGESVQAIGHSFGQWIITQEPTATGNGTQKRSCAICGTEETEEIPAIGELPTEPTEPVEPSEPTTPSVPETEPTELPTTPSEPAAPSSQATKPTATQPAPNGGEEEGTPVMTIVIIAVAVLAIAVVAVVVLKKKK